MKLIKFLSILIVSLVANLVSAQDDLLNQLDSIQPKQNKLKLPRLRDCKYVIFSPQSFL